MDASKYEKLVEWNQKYQDDLNDTLNLIYQIWFILDKDTEYDFSQEPPDSFEDFKNAVDELCELAFTFRDDVRSEEEE